MGKPKRTKLASRRTNSKRKLNTGFGCACGCGEPVKKGSRLKQGHDARLRPNSKWRREHAELFKS